MSEEDVLECRAFFFFLFFCFVFGGSVLFSFLVCLFVVSRTE